MAHNRGMGLFASRPEEPSEWAGLPSEPLEPESEADRLDDGIDIDPAGLVGSGFGSIVIPVEPVDGTAQSRERIEPD